MNAAELQTAIQAQFPDLQPIPKVQGQVRGDELYLAVPAEKLIEAGRFLRQEPALSFDFLSFITSVDFKDRFEVVYYLLSTRHHHKLVLKVNADHASPEVPTVTPVWPAADWQEREIFDLMGIRFKGHYNLRRILLPDDWEGYPLRKDYAPKADRYD